VLRSIRLSLILYFLGLLLVAVGAASYWTYHLAMSSLDVKEETTAELIDSQYREHCRQEEQRLNDALLYQAQTLARMTYFATDRHKSTQHRLASQLGLITARHVGMNGWANLATFAYQAQVGSHTSFLVWRRSLAEIRLGDLDLLKHAEGQVAEFFQIDSSWGSSVRSATMEGLSFPGSTKQLLTGDEAISWEFDTTALDKTPVRRVILKVPATRALPTDFTRWDFSRPQQGGQNPGGRPGPGREPPRPPTPPEPATPGTRYSLVIQCACELDRHEAALAGLLGRRDQELHDLHTQTDAALANLRERLWWLGGLTFAAIVVGTLGIVRWGLRPLRRLSDAVGQVSPRDFQLPFDPATMPVELRPIVQHLTATLQMLKRAFQREKQATADISHELRTPLAAMLTTIDLALRKPRSGDEYRDMLAECKASAQSMNRIVERLLTLARLDAGVDVVRPQAIDVGELAEECAAAVRPLAEAHGLRLTVRHDPDLPASTDPDKLREVLTNLLHNAVQYNRPNGAIEIVATEADGHIQVEVRDTGIGIAPDAVGLIFERFYRADPSRSSDGLNAGLGLAIVKEYVELLGGTIAVESQPGRGTTFRVDLPPVLART